MSAQENSKEGASLELHSRERSRFRQLILAKPNYFGNLSPASDDFVLKVISNTVYEEIKCVGYRPRFEELEAVVYIKQPGGYGGGICSDGTPEYVRFYLSFDDGVTWKDQGLASFTARNIPEGTQGAKQLEYDVTLKVDPPRKLCFGDNLIMARAILSWNFPPPADEPDFKPVWGNVHDTHIQVDPLGLIPIKDLVAAGEFELQPNLAATLDLSQKLAVKETKSLGAVELAELYRGKVEPHRFALTEAQQFLSQPSSDDNEFSVFKDSLAKLGFDLGDLIEPLSPGDGNTSYEELDCVGLNPNTESLVGVIRVKKPAGYSGGPCTAGSKEYVTFWADFNNNGFFETCLGTAEVTVYDFDKIPDKGLEYAVKLPVDFTHHRQPCEDGAKVVPIRAILSWQVKPPCNNPNFVPVWGNREETLIQVPAGPKIPVGTVIPKISILGGIPTSKIHDFTGLTTNDAIFALNNLPPDPWGRPCPFGGRVSVQGPQFVGFKYRVQVRRVGEVFWTTVANPFKVVDFNGDIHDQNPDNNGLFTFLPFTQNIANLLAIWSSSGDDLWQVRLQVFTLGGALLPGMDSHRIRLDNTGPDASIQIDSGAGNCGKFNAGVMMNGHFVARDTYLRNYSVHVKPDINAAGVGVPAPSSGIVQTAVAPGDAWTLDTNGMQPCGYIIEVTVRDRSILNSASVGHFRSDSAGFCIE